MESLSLTFGLSHRVRDRIYWTKVLTNTLVSIWPVQPVKTMFIDTLGSINTFVQ
jgi:hypothetical protein